MQDKKPWGFRPKPDLKERIQAFQEEQHRTRANAIEYLVIKGLEAHYAEVQNKKK